MFGIEARPIPPLRHNKNILESKHRITRNVFLRLPSAAQACDSSPDTSVLVLQSIRISNDLYGNDVMSAHELAKGYTRPLVPGCPTRVPDELQTAHDL